MHRFTLLSAACLSLAGLTGLPALAQNATTPAASTKTAPSPAPAAANAARQKELQTALAITEPGAQRRSLEAFAKKYPHAPELDQVYATLIQDAAQLNDARGVLTYNEDLEAVDPNDLGQRIKTINLLLLETDHADEVRVQQDAATFARQVAEKAAEPQPDDMSTGAWKVSLDRLRALADLFQGTAAQDLHQWPQAETYLSRSLQESQTEEAAEHLADVQEEEGKTAAAVDSFATALSLPGDTIAGRARLRDQAGALYAELHHGSQVGFGDLILKKFDAVAARDAATQAELNGPDANAHAGTAGAFVLESLDGHTHRLADYAGQVVVVSFWATWCQPCRIEHPLLEAVKQKFAHNHNVIFIAINEDSDRSQVAPFLTKHKWGRGTWLDAGLADYLGVDALPTTLIFSPKGAVVYRQEGLVPGTFETVLTQAIRTELASAFPKREFPRPSRPTPAA